ncbi:MAG: sigma-70 family RNA polymerase sigma factor [Leptospirales bacterium]
MTIDDFQNPMKPENWVLEFGDALFQYALHILKDRERSEDAVQETFLAALRAKEQYSGRSSVKNWLFGILKHKIVDIIRQDSRYIRAGDCAFEEDDSDFEDLFFNPNGSWKASPKTWENPESSFENREFWRHLDICLEELPPRTVQIFFLHEMEDRSTEAICQELNVAPTNVWKALSRARMKLRDCLERHGFGRG